MRVILDNLDAECKRAVERLNRKLGQHVRSAKKAQSLQLDRATKKLDAMLRWALAGGTIRVQYPNVIYAGTIHDPIR